MSILTAQFVQQTWTTPSGVVVQAIDSRFEDGTWGWRLASTLKGVTRIADGGLGRWVHVANFGDVAERYQNTGMVLPADDPHSGIWSHSRNS
jgi:hypothetical protein